MSDEPVVWPEPVQNYVQEMIDCITDLLTEGEVSTPVLQEELSKVVLQKFLAGEDLMLTDTEFEQAYQTAAITTALEGLKSKGLLDSIPDEKGDEVFWLTGAGKEVAIAFSQYLAELDETEDQTGDAPF